MLLHVSNNKTPPSSLVKKNSREILNNKRWEKQLSHENEKRIKWKNKQKFSISILLFSSLSKIHKSVKLLNTQIDSFFVFNLRNSLCSVFLLELTSYLSYLHVPIIIFEEIYTEFINDKITTIASCGKLN